jgi:ElaB/YqjD/DUF883 family membrane-anchored ribosome-binding protein
MAVINRSTRTKQQAAANGTPADRTASGRLRKQAREVSKDLRAMGGTARDAAKERIGQLGENASELYDQGRDKAFQVKRTLEQFILDQPLKSVLVAGGVGLLLGRFWMRR